VDIWVAWLRRGLLVYGSGCTHVKEAETTQGNNASDELQHNTTHGPEHHTNVKGLRAVVAH
jgi:hypothetical protein